MDKYQEALNRQKNNVKNELKIKAVSGGIYKTYAESWFKVFNLHSTLMKMFSDHSRIRYHSTKDEYLYERTTTYYNDYEEAKPITILQMVFCGDNEVVAEIIYIEDLIKHLVSNENMGEKNNE